MTPAQAALLARARDPAFVARAAAETGLPPARIASMMADYGGEARRALEILSDYPLAGKRVLDVGAGIGLLAAALRIDGIETVGIEPAAGGFDHMARLARAFAGWIDAPAPLALDAATLPGAGLGPFDLICSFNVIEHIPDLESALAGMAAVLAVDGIMLHLAPNYRIPYEPHFGVPLLPLVPRRTGRLLPRLRKHPVWQSLNFVTAGRLRRCAERLGLEIRFVPGLLGHAFARLASDQVFGARHPTLAGLARALRPTGLPMLIGRLPPAWVTPMLVELRRPRTG